MNSTYQNKIHLSRVYNPPKVKEGAWILVDRLWPRGLKKESLVFDLWLKEITPSTPLRQWFHGDVEARWSEFVNGYIKELDHKDDLIEPLLEMAKHTPITLFYAAKDPRHNHARILQAALYSWPNPPDKNLLD